MDITRLPHRELTRLTGDTISTALTLPQDSPTRKLLMDTNIACKRERSLRRKAYEAICDLVQMGDDETFVRPVMDIVDDLRINR